ncbi:hypothetical protein EDC01DRAFT_625802 [Geopyxis carbonaria]|nr:hypothetical protein EDC01DRAFT_625802 [Geopyxis carbonaria]
MPVNAGNCHIPHYTARPLQFAGYGENQQAVLGLVYTLALRHVNNITKVKGPWSHDIPLAACLQTLDIVAVAPDGSTSDTTRHSSRIRGGGLSAANLCMIPTTGHKVKTSQSHIGLRVRETSLLWARTPL